MFGIAKDILHKFALPQPLTLHEVALKQLSRVAFPEEISDGEAKRMLEEFRQSLGLMSSLD